MPKVTAKNIKSRPNANTKFVWSEKESARVSSLMSTGLSVRDSARLLGMSEFTFYKLYRKEIQTGHAKQVEAVATTLYGIATNPNHPKCVPAAIFFLKTRARGWSEKIVVEGPDGGAIQVEHRHSIEARDLSPEQRDSLRAILQEVMERRKQAALEGPKDEDVMDADYEEVVDDDVDPTA